MATVIHRCGPGKGDWYVYGPWGRKVYIGSARLTKKGFRQVLAEEIWGKDSSTYPEGDYRKTAMEVLNYSRIGDQWIEDSIISALLRALREKSGLTQEQLAEKSGVPVGTIRDLEQGRRTDPTWSTVCKLAAGLEVDLNTLAQAAPPLHLVM